jgi:hypothetical protein
MLDISRPLSWVGRGWDLSDLGLPGRREMSQVFADDQVRPDLGGMCPDLSRVVSREMVEAAGIVRAARSEFSYLVMLPLDRRKPRAPRATHVMPDTRE